MSASDEGDEQSTGLEQLLDTPDLAEAIESDRFKQFLDRLPVAIAVSELRPREYIVYANSEFERLSNRSGETIIGEGWSVLTGATPNGTEIDLGNAITDSSDFIGVFTIQYEDACSRRSMPGPTS